MPIPQVNDRIKEAPVVVLRAVFAGIGQLLLTADKVRARAAEQVWTPERAPGPAGQPRHCPVPPQPRNGIAHAEPAAASHPATREAVAGPGTATAPAPGAAPAAKAGSGPAGSVPHPAPGADREKATPAAKTTPTAKATARTTPAPKATAKTAKAAPVAKAAKSTVDAKSATGAKVATDTPDAKAAGAKVATDTPDAKAAGAKVATDTPDAKAAGAKTASPKAAGAKNTKTTPTAKPGPATKTKAVPAPRAGKAGPAKAGPATEAPPLPGYDDMSLASLRARLRGLDATTIRAMLAYERASARREPVITMLERRLTKITSG